jgi:uncharacterized protein YqjF (DUF2071 family)
MTMPPEIDRISPTRPPSDSPSGFHVWQNLTFVHWRVPADVLRPLIPPALTIDTYAGDAWVGIVPFYMSRIRPWWSPPVPGVSWFCETNVRTYVHRNGTDPAVWFFGLDAANSLAVWIARNYWHLNYFRGDMKCERRGDRVVYESRRRRSATGSHATLTAELKLGPLLPSVDGLPDGVSAPGTLEHFLFERYLMFGADRRGRLLRGQVHHEAYRIRRAEIERFDQTLTTAAGIPRVGVPEHVGFCDKVTVRVSPIRACGESGGFAGV